MPKFNKYELPGGNILNEANIQDNLFSVKIDNKHLDYKPELEAASEYENMSKEQLIQELMKSKVREARLKKGYMVKGVGANKEFVPLNNKSIK